jgi:hypothetical protein
MDKNQPAYRADFNKNAPSNITWKPSIHMPKAACRIFLEITNIRVERLKDISEEDAVKEGVEVVKTGYKDYITEGSISDAYWSFYSLWYKINGRESWSSNPYVWVIEFKQIVKTQTNE